MAKQRATQKERTLHAFAAYLELVDTADWMRGELAGPLAYFGVTMNEFRLMLLLQHEGRMGVIEAAKSRKCGIQFMHKLAERMEAKRWVRRDLVARAPAKIRQTRLPKAKRGRPRRGRKARMLSLTRDGRSMLGMFLTKHAKLVKALMRVLDMREQETLSRLCRKLREGNFLKFVSELGHEDAGEDLRV